MFAYWIDLVCDVKEFGKTIHRVGNCIVIRIQITILKALNWKIAYDSEESRVEFL